MVVPPKSKHMSNFWLPLLEEPNGLFFAVIDATFDSSAVLLAE